MEPQAAFKCVGFRDPPRRVIEAAARAAGKMFVRGIIGGFHKSGVGGVIKNSVFYGDGPWLISSVVASVP